MVAPGLAAGALQEVPGWEQEVAPSPPTGRPVSRDMKASK